MHTEKLDLPRRREQAIIALDANESPFNAPDNRYPREEWTELCTLYGCHERIPQPCIYFCNGTEEAIDLSMRAFLRKPQAKVVSVSPTRSIYGRRAAINRATYVEVPLRADDFSLDLNALLGAIDDHTEMVILCSPNSPTGNLLSKSDIEELVQLFDGLIVLDESYIDFNPRASLLSLLNQYRNLVVLRSFSHAWSAAGLRLAAAIAHPDVIERLRSVGLTHPLSTPVIRLARQMLARRMDVDKWVRQIIEERTKVELALKELPDCLHIYPSSANFLLVRFADARAVYKYLKQQGIAVRPYMGCLRLTIGLPNENSALLGALRRRKDNKADEKGGSKE